jgi:hypothetical protein
MRRVLARGLVREARHHCGGKSCQFCRDRDGYTDKYLKDEML